MWALAIVVIGLSLWICLWPKSEEIIEPVEVVEVVKKPIFKFAVMADIHNDNEQLAKALRQAQGDLVVLAGDLTINVNKSELLAVKKTLDESAREYLVVAGNHDVIKKQFENVFGKSYQSYSKDNLKLILIDNSNWKGLGEEQKIWIEQEVQGCNVILCVSIMHMPLEHNFSNHVMGEDNEIGTEDAKWLHKVLVDSGVKTIYAGHLHYSSGYTIDNLKTNLVGAISRERNNQTSRMVEVEFDGKALINRVVEIE